MAAERNDIEKVLGLDRKQRRRGVLLAVVLLVAAVAAGGWYWMRGTPQDHGAGYVTAAVTRGDLTVTVTATGTVEPTNLVEVSSELSGTVRSVNVDYNDTVTKGEVLAELDTDKLEAALAHSQATLDVRQAKVAEATATVAETQAQYERTRQLAERDYSSVQALQAATAALARARAAADVARADVEVAQADLRTDEANLAKAKIRSPINGVVLERNVDVGQVVASSLQAPVLFTIAEDLRQMELWVDIDEADVAAVRVQHKATFTVDAYQGRTFPAEIAQLRYAPYTVDGVVTYRAVLSIDNSDMLLRPGMTATAEIVVARVSDALLVPNAALRFSPPVAQESSGKSGGGLLGLLISRPSLKTGTPAPAAADGTRTIWVLRDGKAVPVQVRTGQTDGLKTVVLDGGLKAGDRVITDVAGA